MGLSGLSRRYAAPVAGAERFISFARLVLAAASLFAVWLDPSSPAKYAAAAHTLLLAFLIYAAALFAVVMRFRAVPRMWPMLTHGIDLVSFGALMYLTEGPSSPFFVYFVFSIVAATIRWQARGAIWTALVALTMFVSLGAYSASLHDTSFEMNRFIIRGFYLAVAAALLHYMGRYHERLDAELARIAAWGWHVPSERRGVVADVLEHLAGILRVPRLLLLFEEPEEPWVNVVSGPGPARLDWHRHDPDLLEQLESGELGTRSVIARCVQQADGPVLIVETPPPFTIPLDRRLAALVDDLPFVTCSIGGEGWRGRLFALGRKDPTVDNVRLAEVLGALAAARLDHMFLVRRLRDAAVGDERMRFARDLHDGLLQSLAGAALQLRVARGLIEVDPQDARTRIQEVEEMLSSEQRDLRVFIRHLKPQSASADEDFPLAARLEQLAGRVRRQWGMDVQLSIGSLELVPAALHGEAYRLAHEALINAARHAGATLVRAHIGVQANALTISVEDDGHGFPFKGTYDLAMLIRLRTGPATLKDRVTALGGRLSISSSESGARIAIDLPLASSA